jgi:hypothetical protein
MHAAARRLAALREIAVAILLSVELALSAPAAAAANSPPTFASEQEAKKHCPSDVVVWLNLPTGVYHFKGQRWYGRTKSGAFVCKKEADVAGNRGSLNGQ